MLLVRNLAARLRAGSATARATLDASLALVDADPEIARCFLRVDAARARATAAALDATRGDDWPRSGIAGLPVAHKDLFASAGDIVTFGTHPSLHRRARTTATALTRLATAGAIDLGALHMSEFAMGPAGFSEYAGFIENPRDPTRVSGGSSSGSAAAVAHGVVAAALGTDTGGSIRIPAAFCGVVGVKPTNGLVPVDGVFPVSATLDCVGHVAADIAGAARLLDVLVASGSIRAPGSHERALDADPRALRVGVLAASSLPVPPDADVSHAWADAAARLARLGIDVVDVAFPALPALNALAGTVFLSEAAAVHASSLQRSSERYGPQVRERLLQGLVLPAAAYLAALAVRPLWIARWNAEVFGACDVLMLPVTPSTAPSRTRYIELPDTGAINDFNARLGSYTPAFNYLGLPVLAVPIGGGIGMQLVAASNRDADTFRIGAALERALDN